MTSTRKSIYVPLSTSRKWKNSYFMRESLDLEEGISVDCITRKSRLIMLGTCESRTRGAICKPAFQAINHPVPTYPRACYMFALSSLWPRLHWEHRRSLCGGCLLSAFPACVAIFPYYLSACMPTRKRVATDTRSLDFSIFARFSRFAMHENRMCNLGPRKCQNFLNSLQRRLDQMQRSNSSWESRTRHDVAFSIMTSFYCLHFVPVSLR